MRPEDIQKKLTDFSNKNDLANRAIECCKKVLNQLFKEDGGKIGGFEVEELILDCNEQSLILKSHRPGVPFVRTQIGIYGRDPENVWFRGLEPVGKYELDTNLNNEDIDDWLSIDKTKNEVG